MASYARHPAANHSVFEPFDVDDEFSVGALVPGDRIGALPRRRARWTRRLGTIVILAAAVAGWRLLDGPTAWGWLLAAGNSMLSQGAGPNIARTEPTVQPAAASEPLPALESTFAAGMPLSVPEPAPLSPAPVSPPATAAAAVAETAPTIVASAAPPAASPSERPSPLQEGPLAEPLDPLQKRAEAVGLHPELSRSLLERLSPTDYRNAAIAIKTALAETPDSAVHAWPKQRKGDLAHFKVHFVPGAAVNCRRYVVTVTKDGWVTTAQPMEKCGVRGPASRAASGEPPGHRAALGGN